MFKKFIGCFVLIFSLSFGLLNSRFILAQGKYYLDRRSVLADENPSSDFAGRILPISESRHFFLEIPSLKITAPIILEKSIDQNKIFARLADGVVHYENTPLPGEKGTAIILGHSSAYPWYKGRYGSVFALLGKLKEGDVFYINNGDKTYSYRVAGSLVFNPFDKKNEQFKQIENTAGSSILLVSCWPVGTDYKRIAVKADLVN